MNLSDHIDYKVKCPNAEFLHNKSLICFEMCLHELNDTELEQLIDAFKKVFLNADIL